MNRAVIDDAAPQLGPALGEKGPLGPGEIQVIGDLAHEDGGGGVHVERERGGCAVAAEFLGHQGVGHEVAAEPAVADGDAQPEQASVAQVGPVLGGERGVAVVGLGPLCKARPESRHALHQLGPLRPEDVCRYSHAPITHSLQMSIAP